MKIYIGNDHTGVEIKNYLVSWLKQNNYEVIDLGVNLTKSSNYALIGKTVAENVVKDNGLGIVICGTGVGISIAANKVKGAIAGLVYETQIAQLIRQHNNANILAMGARIIAKEKALEILKVFLSTDFEGGRHIERVELLKQ
ncbi:ribose 5-phosphate isomerase B [Spiroplasma endosymbiont of Crioceris asparagi]|uniref:ribose 5-phosphate isomerase B n=1 Tax=Spiroplasma endosymbiont of Crioceris asparagi TaxID=3066286 RepID=UPI0030CF0B35